VANRRSAADESVSHPRMASFAWLTYPPGIAAVDPEPDMHAARKQSITSSARNSSDCGIVRPSASAVRRLTISSNFVGCSTPTNVPVRRQSTRRTGTRWSARVRRALLFSAMRQWRYWMPKFCCSSTSILRLPIRALVCAFVQFATEPVGHGMAVPVVELQHRMSPRAFATTW